MEAPIPPEESLNPRAIIMRQMDAVADYLAQAKAANRSADEIHSLAQNLSELELELTRLTRTPEANQN